MNGLTTITTKGQVTIPEKIRRALGVKVGDKVYFSHVFADKKQIWVKIMSKNTVEKLYGSLKSKEKYLDLETVREKSIKKLVKKYNLKWNHWFVSTQIFSSDFFSPIIRNYHQKLGKYFFPPKMVNQEFI